MRLNLETSDTANIIRAYRDGAVSVNGQNLCQSIIVTPERLIPDWPPQSFEQLQREHFQIIVELRPELLIVGTGSRQRFPRPDLMRCLLENNIGVETMNTAAACRTYNIVVAEGRRVAAALLMI